MDGRGAAGNFFTIFLSDLIMIRMRPGVVSCQSKNRLSYLNYMSSPARDLMISSFNTDEYRGAPRGDILKFLGESNGHHTTNQTKHILPHNISLRDRYAFFRFRVRLSGIRAESSKK